MLESELGRQMEVHGSSPVAVVLVVGEKTEHLQSVKVHLSKVPPNFKDLSRSKVHIRIILLSCGEQSNLIFRINQIEIIM